MPQTSTPQKVQEAPTLLMARRRQTFATGELLQKLKHVEAGETDFGRILRSELENCDTQYLFEMPGSLFGSEALKAFALQQGRGENAEHGFMTFDPETGTIAIMQRHKISTRAQAFFLSYVSVLGCLSEIPAVRKLH